MIRYPLEVSHRGLMAIFNWWNSTIPDRVSVRAWTIFKSWLKVKKHVNKKPKKDIKERLHCMLLNRLGLGICTVKDIQQKILLSFSSTESRFQYKLNSRMHPRLRIIAGLRIFKDEIGEMCVKTDLSILICVLIWSDKILGVKILEIF